MKILCKCGCKQLTSGKINYKFKKFSEYIHGHNPVRRMLGKKHTQEWKDSLSKKMKGKKLSKEWTENIRKSKLKEKNPMYGKTPWNKGLKGVMPIPWNKGKHLEGMRGENNPRWKGGIPNCIDCGKQLSTRYGKHQKCKKCL